MSKAHKSWCKIIDHPEFGQVLARVEYDACAEVMTFTLSYHGPIGFVEIRFSSEDDSDEAEKWAFDCLSCFTPENATAL